MRSLSRTQTGEGARSGSPFADNSLDLAFMQGLLHQDDDPQDIIREAFRVAPAILFTSQMATTSG